MKKEYLYISNLISFSRFFLLLLTLLFLFDNSYFLAFVFIILIWLSDLADGYIARKRNEISELGKIIDPLADKVSVAGIVLVLLFKEIIPLWFVIVVIFRDLLILFGALYLKYRKNIVLQSDIAGKLCVFLIGLTILVIVLRKAFAVYGINYIYENMELFINILLLLSIVISVYSLIHYFIKFIKTFNN